MEERDTLVSRSLTPKRKGGLRETLTSPGAGRRFTTTGFGMSYQEMDPIIIHSLLSGRESVIPQMQEKDTALREDIATRSCPECGESLIPSLPTDPARIFRGTGFHYEGVCPEHGVISR